MPSVLARKATLRGCDRARSSSRAGAVLRLSSSANIRRGDVSLIARPTLSLWVLARYLHEIYTSIEKAAGSPRIRTDGPSADITPTLPRRPRRQPAAPQGAARRPSPARRRRAVGSRVHGGAR